MYINPFLAGVLATVGVELIVLVVYALVTAGRRKK